MSNKAVYGTIGLIAGIAIATWFFRTPETQFTDTPEIDVAVETQFAELERTVTDQIESMKSEMESLRGELAMLSETPNVRAVPSSQLSRGAVVANSSSLGAISDEIELNRLLTLARKGLVETLTEAGFSLARGQDIERLIDANRLAATQARFEAARRGESTAQENAQLEERFDTDTMLRAELGDADFAQYLEAVGRPTEVMVVDVFSSSAAEQAGMVSGDRIVSYDGHRVFGVMELTPLALEGDPGSPVIVDILRDGQPMQLVLPRGPLGIIGSAGSPIQVFPNELE